MSRIVTAPPESTTYTQVAPARCASLRLRTLPTPSGFEWEVGWNPIVVDETTWQPTTYQGISIWGHTREGQTIVDKFAQFKTLKASAASLLRDEDVVPALAGAGIADN